MFLQEKRTDCGKMLHLADTKSCVARSLQRQRFLFISYCSCFLVFALFTGIILATRGDALSPSGFASSHWSWTYASLIGFSFLGMVYSCASLVTISFSRDSIYEKGITSFNHNFLEFLRGETFHSFENITRIETGRLQGTRSRKGCAIIRLFERNSRRPALVLDSSSFRGDYWDQLLRVLQQNCPAAAWTALPPRTGGGAGSSNEYLLLQMEAN